MNQPGVPIVGLAVIAICEYCGSRATQAYRASGPVLRRSRRTQFTACLMLACAVVACSGESDVSRGQGREAPVLVPKPQRQYPALPENIPTPERASARLPQFCSSDPLTRIRDYVKADTARASGDVAGFAVRLERALSGVTVVRGSEAIGEFGPMEPVTALVLIDSAPTIQFRMSLIDSSIHGPTLTLRLSCDSLWGIAVGPYAGATEQRIVLPRVR